MESIHKLFTNTWNTFFLKKISKNNFFLTLIYFSFEKPTGQSKPYWEICILFFLFNIRLRYSWILWKIFVNGNNIHQITIFANRNNIHEMKVLRIGIGIYLWAKYQRIDSSRIYSQTIRELFANRELFAEHWCSPVSYSAVFPDKLPYSVSLTSRAHTLHILCERPPWMSSGECLSNFITLLSEYQFIWMEERQGAALLTIPSKKLNWHFRCQKKNYL